MNCKTCKHWRRGGCFEHVWSASATPGGERFVVGPNTGGTDEVVDLHTDPDAKFGMCLNPIISCCGRNSWLGWVNSDDPRGVKTDADGERGTLETGQDFGCIHWEGK